MSNDMAQEPTAKIPVENLPQLREKIAKLNKVADKLGLKPIEIQVGEPETQQINSGVTMIDGPYGGQMPSDQIFQEVVPVTVVGEAPRLNGWEFIATLEHDENGTLIRRIPTFGDEVDLSQYRTATPDNCDHCGYKRRRNDTYIVVNETGGTKQVGSNCLKDFTGHENPQAIARFLEQVRDLIETVAGGGYSEGRVIPRYSLEELMATAAMVIRENGYTSRRVAQETDRVPTAEAVKLQFFDRLNNRTYRGEPLWEAPSDADYAKAAKVIEWVQSLTEEDLASDYLYNLFTVCKSGTLTDRQFGIAASAILPYDRIQERKCESTQRPTRVDAFLGEEKERVEVTFTVLQVFHNETDYGVEHKHVLRADTGHRMIWKSTTFELEQGKRYHGTFTIKGLVDGSKYGKETLIFRPKKGDPQEV